MLGPTSQPTPHNSFRHRGGKQSTGEGENGMEEASPESGGGAAVPASPLKGKSCKGCLYYSSVLKSRGYNPICVGIPRSIPQGRKP
jgi:hypothetical protein